MADVLILIPARMASTRLPGKPLADIAGEPMIVHVMRRAQAADVGPVVVATDSEAIAACVEKAGGRAVMTRADHVSRVRPHLRGAASRRPAAARQHHRQRAGRSAHARALRHRRRDRAARRSGGRHRHAGGRDQRGAEERTDPNVVKVVGTPVSAATAARALFHPRHARPRATARSIITSASTPIAARRSPVSSRLPPSPLEQRERLEQLRALEAGMRIDVTIVDSVPLGVDTPEELERARDMLKTRPVDLMRPACVPERP